MPCNDGSDAIRDESINYMYKKLDKVTRLLCFLCKQIELGDNANYNSPEYKELWEWWQEHKKIDAARGL